LTGKKIFHLSTRPDKEKRKEENVRLPKEKSMTPAAKTLRSLVMGEPELFWDANIDFGRFRQICL
jgi:hypothetical protein